MGELESRLESVPGMGRDLTERSRHGREDAQRLAAMTRAEAVGRAAAAMGEEPWDISPESKAHFGSALTWIDERAGAIPDAGAVIRADSRALRESAARGNALRKAERAELRPAGLHSEPQPEEAHRA